MGRSCDINMPFGILAIGVVLTAIVSHPREFKACGYDLYLFDKWMDELLRYNAWRDIWDTTEEQDWIKGYAS
jgi:hypothetical protein